mmetsp:Transcript_11747/g.25407  ORF Transcript_11747/g.25407 Transcript_11747/m.25407 type:complete len:282 (-) Transcript_11747:112-957(-)
MSACTMSCIFCWVVDRHCRRGRRDPPGVVSYWISSSFPSDNNSLWAERVARVDLRAGAARSLARGLVGSFFLAAVLFLAPAFFLLRRGAPKSESLLSSSSSSLPPLLSLASDAFHSPPSSSSGLSSEDASSSSLSSSSSTLPFPAMKLSFLRGGALFLATSFLLPPLFGDAFFATCFAPVRRTDDLIAPPLRLGFGFSSSDSPSSSAADASESSSLSSLPSSSSSPSSISSSFFCCVAISRSMSAVVYRRAFRRDAGAACRCGSDSYSDPSSSSSPADEDE